MAKKKSTPKLKGVSFVTKKARDGTESYLALVRVGKFKPTSRTFKSMEAARAWAAEKVADLKGADVDTPAEITSLTISQLLTKYLAALRDDPEGTAPKTYSAYCEWANWWKAEFGNEKVSEFGLHKINDARRRLLGTKGRLTGRKWSPITVNRHLSLMRSAWNWARNTGWIPLKQDRMWPTNLMLKEKARIRFLSSEELDAVMAAVDSDQVMKAAILVAISTGVRQGELLGLKWADINFAKQHLTLLETKTDTARRVYIPSAAVEALQGLKARPVVSPIWVFLTRDGKPMTAPTLNARWREIRKAAKLEDFRWHDLRHTCASYLAQNGSTLLEIGGVLGHKSPTMTAKYSHLVQGAPVTGHAALDAMLKGK